MYIISCSTMPIVLNKDCSEHINGKSDAVTLERELHLIYINSNCVDFLECLSNCVDCADGSTCVTCMDGFYYQSSSASCERKYLGSAGFQLCRFVELVLGSIKQFAYCCLLCRLVIFTVQSDHI